MRRDMGLIGLPPSRHLDRARAEAQQRRERHEAWLRSVLAGGTTP